MAEGLLKNILRTFCVQALGFAVNLACGILIARHLGPTGRGDWAAITSVISIIATFSYFAAGYAIVYLRSSTDLTRHELFRAAIVISLVGTLICLTAALIGSAWLSQGSRAAFTHCLLLYGAGQLFANAGTFVSMIFLADRQFGRANLAGLLPRLLVLIGYGGLLLFRRFTVLDVVLVNIGASGLLLGWLLFWFRDAFSERSSLWPVALGRMLRYGIKVWLGLLAQAVTMRADQVIMAALLPRAVLGLYAVSVTVAELAGFFAGAAGFIIGPTAANLQGAELTRAIGRSFRVTGLIVVGTALAMYAAGPLLIHALYGARYDGAAVSFHWLVIAGVPMSLFSLCKDVLVSRGQAALNTRVQCLGAVVTLLCCSLLIKSFGLVGAGVASFLAYSIVAGVALICVSRSTGVPLRSMMIPKTNDIAGLRSRLMKGKGLAAEA